MVFYANYLKFFERARTEWLRSMGIGQQQLRDETGAMFVVTATNVRYLKPARLDDEIVVTVGRNTGAASQHDHRPGGLAGRRAAGDWQHTHRLCRCRNLPPETHSDGNRPAARPEPIEEENR